jgi:hypothetical protein
LNNTYTEDVSVVDAEYLTVRPSSNASFASDRHKSVVLGREAEGDEFQTTEAGSPASLPFLGAKLKLVLLPASKIE